MADHANQALVAYLFEPGPESEDDETPQSSTLNRKPKPKSHYHKNPKP